VPRAKAWRLPESQAVEKQPSCTLAGRARPTGCRFNHHNARSSTVRGERTSEYRRTEVGLVFQHFNLIPSLA